MGHDLVPPAPLVLGGEPLPLVGPARIYACGVTPYDVTHLGHAATFVWVDALVRTLRHANVTPIVTRNITDVDDVLTEAARKAGAPYDEFAAIHQYDFDHDMSHLGVRRPDHEPRAHQHIGSVVRLAAALLDRGAAYEVDGTVYFRGAIAVASAGLGEAEVLAALTEFGEDVDDRAKESPVDVPVWRASHGNDPAWPSPWGPGRPGWHAECTAMVLDTYGSSLDIHAGGADLAFPHHAYEAAQAEAATGVAPFARSWMRVGTVRIGGDKMAKSTGNLVLVSDLLKEHRGAALRLMILDRRWWEAWDFEPGLLTAAEGRLDALHAAAGRRSDDDAAEAEVMRLLLDDIDVPSATAVALESGGRAARVLVQVLGLS
ncbi:MAG: cysteine--tRNA ligase [Candidatus Nanopelagicales bacterium]|jgi:cysteinyl-tRNA synthetase